MLTADVCAHGPRAVFLCQYEGHFWLRRAKDTWLTNRQCIHLLEPCAKGFGHTVEDSHFPFACFGCVAKHAAASATHDDKAAVP